MSYLDVLENGDNDYDKRKVVGEVLCTCEQNFATLLCVNCGKFLCALCVSDFHYKAGPLCLSCLIEEKKQQQILSTRSF